MQISFNQDHIFHSISSLLVFPLSVLRVFLPHWRHGERLMNEHTPLCLFQSIQHDQQPETLEDCNQSSDISPFHMHTVIHFLFFINFCGFTAFWTGHSFPPEYHSSPFRLLFLSCSLMLYFICSSLLSLSVSSFTVLSWLTPCQSHFAPLRNNVTPQTLLSFLCVQSSAILWMPSRRHRLKMCTIIPIFKRLSRPVALYDGLFF